LLVALASVLTLSACGGAAGGGAAQKQVQEERIYSPNCVEVEFYEFRNR